MLVDETFVLSECSAILRYLAEGSASDLYPSDAKVRARIDEALSWLGSDVYVAVAVMTVYPQAFGPKGKSVELVEELGREAAPKIERQLEILDRQLASGKHVAGDALSIADFVALAYLTLVELIDFDFSRWPAIVAWIDRMQALPGWQETYRPFNGLVKMRREQRRQSKAL